MEPAEPRNTTTIATANFDRDAIVRYHWTGLLMLSVFIVTIPFTIICALIYKIVLDRVVAAWSAELTPQSLIVRKGVWNKVERTIPLEKITDLSVSQGPIMRLCGIDRIGVETAGQTGSQTGAPLINLLGVQGSKSFRASVLAQRDALSGGTPAASPEREKTPSDDRLAEIAATLRRIEALLQRSP